MQAHARLMAREEVLEPDSLVAIMLIDASMVESGLLHCNPLLDLSSGNPEQDFQLTSEQLLQLLSVAQ